MILPEVEGDEVLAVYIPITKSALLLRPGIFLQPWSMAGLLFRSA